MTVADQIKLELGNMRTWSVVRHFFDLERVKYCHDRVGGSRRFELWLQYTLDGKPDRIAYDHFSSMRVPSDR